MPQKRLEEKKNKRLQEVYESWKLLKKKCMYMMDCTHISIGEMGVMLEATAGLNKLLISKFLEHALPIYMSTLRETCRATGVIYFVNNAISRCGE